MDCSWIKKINILGVNIAVIKMDELVDFIENNIAELKGEYICVSNVHTTVMSHDDKFYRMVQNNSILSIPDGAPLSVVGRRRGYDNMQRTTGPDLMEKLFQKENISMFFYGSTNKTLDKLQTNLRKKFPKIKIVGKYSPPFRPLSKEEDDAIIEMINKQNADIVWIGLGAPKQEIWMYNHKNKINSLMIGVGAGFDYFAGNIKRAPMWMQRNSLEWFYRLMQNPKRLFKRYLFTNFKFIFYTLINDNK